VTSDEEFERLAPEHQETAAVLLERNFPDAARLLRAARMEYEHYQYDNWDGGTDIYRAQLIVDARNLHDYTEDVTDQIKWAIEEVVARYARKHVPYVFAVPQMERRRISNQAVTRDRTRLLERHGMRFRSDAEVAMFDALVEKQAQLPKADSILITPLPSVWNGRDRWEPDFLITYRGRAGIIEVDDPTHHKRYVADKSRDQILEECGIALTRRIAIEDAVDATQRREFIDRFLERLASR
jgi:hypothetical protein